MGKLADARRVLQRLESLAAGEAAELREAIQKAGQ